MLPNDATYDLISMEPRGQPDVSPCIKLGAISMGEQPSVSPPEVRKAQLPLLDLPTKSIDLDSDQVLVPNQRWQRNRAEGTGLSLRMNNRLRELALRARMRGPASLSSPLRWIPFAFGRVSPHKLNFNVKLSENLLFIL